MATTQDIVLSLQDLIESSITDPNSNRTGSGEWVYTIPIDFGPAEYPRIHILEVDNTHQPQSIGSNERYMESRIRVNIYNHVDGKFDMDNDGEDERAFTVLDDLKEKIIELINKNQSRWRQIEDCHVYNMTTVNDERYDANREEIIGRRVDAIVKRRR